MGRKKKKSLKPWCWYCNREFDDEKVLIGHQKAKHFRCHICHKKLYTAPGLAIHCSQVHKESISKVPNALPERETLDLEIYGMEGVPEEAKHAREIQKYGRLTEETSLEAKRPKLDPATGAPYQTVMPGFPPVVMPGMPPVMPGMVPPLLGGVPPPSLQAVPPPSSATSIVPPQKPLFPSAVNQPPSSDPVPPPTTAPSAPEVSNEPPVIPEVLKNAPRVNPLPENSQLMHPVEDLSMEEIRALRPQYSKASATPTQPPLSSVPPQGQFPVPPMFRPGMVPPAVGGGMPHQLGPGPMATGNIVRPGMVPPLGMGIRPPGPPAMGHV